MPGLRFPECIQLFADPAYAALTAALAREPAQMGWLLDWQGQQFRQSGTPPDALGDGIQAHFQATPSVVPAFMSLARDLPATLARDTARHPHLATLAMPWGSCLGGTISIWGNLSRALQELLPTSDLQCFAAGHWPQWDAPDEVAQALLARKAKVTDCAISG
ncbi:MAG: hypothetical protein H0X24_09020 [Ktedonobacterales bacterium]|nr:hypothetical protein [Ktedonobacterales bacterium]